MAGTGRRSQRHLNEEILADGPRFRFFQAVRLLALAEPGEDKAALPPGLRFTSMLSLAFPASDITSVAPRRNGRRTPPAKAMADQGEPGADASADLAEALEMSVGFMGLTGPSGALPVAYTELLLDRKHQFRDTTGLAFLDIFTHRAVSLFYRAWRKNRFYLPYEAGNADGFSRNVLDIVGVGLRHLQRRLLTPRGGVPDLFLIHYAGLLSQKPVPAVNIAALVRGFFGVEARAEQFVGQWMLLPGNEQSALDGRPCLLGHNSFLGERLWDRQTKMGLRIGPLDRRQFGRFLPGQPELAALRELVRFCVGLSIDCDVTLVLKKEDIPRAKLRTKASASGFLLGYTSWLNSFPAEEDADNVRFALLGNGASDG